MEAVIAIFLLLLLLYVIGALLNSIPADIGMWLLSIPNEYYTAIIILAAISYFVVPIIYAAIVAMIELLDRQRKDE